MAAVCFLVVLVHSVLMAKLGLLFPHLAGATQDGFNATLNEGALLDLLAADESLNRAFELLRTLDSVLKHQMRGDKALVMDDGDNIRHNDSSHYQQSFNMSGMSLHNDKQQHSYNMTSMGQQNDEQKWSYNMSVLAQQYDEHQKSYNMSAMGQQNDEQKQSYNMSAMGQQNDKQHGYNMTSMGQQSDKPQSYNVSGMAQQYDEHQTSYNMSAMGQQNDEEKQSYNMSAMGHQSDHFNLRRDVSYESTRVDDELSAVSMTVNV
ncbi:uncharacterized protein LOC144211767 [Stigmatopora nigra]